MEHKQSLRPVTAIKRLGKGCKCSKMGKEHQKGNFFFFTSFCLCLERKGATREKANVEKTLKSTQKTGRANEIKYSREKRRPTHFAWRKLRQGGGRPSTKCCAHISAKTQTELCFEIWKKFLFSFSRSLFVYRFIRVLTCGPLQGLTYQKERNVTPMFFFSFCNPTMVWRSTLHICDCLWHLSSRASCLQKKHTFDAFFPVSLPFRSVSNFRSVLFLFVF